MGTLPSRCPCGLRWREQGSGPTWARLFPCSSFSGEHLTFVDLESQLWSQNLTLGDTAGEPEQEWAVTVRGWRSQVTPVMTDMELS